MWLITKYVFLVVSKIKKTKGFVRLNSFTAQCPCVIENKQNSSLSLSIATPPQSQHFVVQYREVYFEMGLAKKKTKLYQRLLHPVALGVVDSSDGTYLA